MFPAGVCGPLTPRRRPRRVSTVDRRSFFRLSSGAAVTTAAFAVSLGPVPAWADGRGDEGPDDPHPSARQFRAMWISLVENIDWPSEPGRSEEHTSELQSRGHLVCRLLLEKKKTHKRKESS